MPKVNLLNDYNELILKDPLEERKENIRQLKTYFWSLVALGIILLLVFNKTCRDFVFYNPIANGFEASIILLYVAGYGNMKIGQFCRWLTSKGYERGVHV